MVLASARFAKQGSNPLTGRNLMNRLATPVLVGGPCAACQQQPDDAGLLFMCLRRTAAAPPHGLNGQMRGVDPALFR